MAPRQPVERFHVERRGLFLSTGKGSLNRHADIINGVGLFQILANAKPLQGLDPLVFRKTAGNHGFLPGLECGYPAVGFQPVNPRRF